MKEITLTQGMVTKVDDDLYEWLNQWKWYYRKRSGTRHSGDAVRSLHGRDTNGVNTVQTIYMASMILPVPTGFVIDHADRDSLNNQRANLRKATNSNNIKNTLARANSKTGVKGVHWDHAKQRYIVQVTVNGKRRWVGAYTDLDTAKKVAEKSIKEHYGSFSPIA